MSEPASGDELVNDDELVFERDPFAAPPVVSGIPPAMAFRTSMPPPLPPFGPSPRSSNPTPSQPANRDESRFPSRADSHAPSRDEAHFPSDPRSPSREESRFPSDMDALSAIRDESRFPSQVDSRSPSRDESRFPSHMDAHSAIRQESRFPSQADSRSPSREESRFPSHVDELRYVRRDASAKGELPLQPGDIIAGKYQVERVLGRVGVGIVAQVRHAELGQRFRLKYLPLEVCDAPDAVSRFLRGARRAMRLQSEHTARTVDAGRLASGAPYVVTEANAGSDLREVMRVRGILTMNEAVDFVLQASESLAEAHAQGLIHKNLNLTTLFVTWRPDGSHAIKVQDFGVAESLRADPLRTSDLNGEPVTMMFDSNPQEALGCLSPEQIRSNPEIDGGADVWALGCILHQLLSGFPVFTATTVPGLLASIAADPATPITAVRSDVPAALESVILRCLEKNRSARFLSLADLANALRRFASPDAQASVDRITRTLGRGSQAPIGMDRKAALVHLGPAAASQAPSAASNIRSAVIPYPLLWSAALIAVGLIGGTIAGVLVATRLPVQHVALEPHVYAQQPARDEPLSPLPVPTAEAATLAPAPAVQAPQTPSLPVAAPVVAPAVHAAARPSPPPVVVARAKPAAKADGDAYDLGTAGGARTGNTASPAAKDAPPTSESAPTANLGKDLFEGVR